MDSFRTARYLLRAYVGLLLLGALTTVAWLVGPAFVSSPILGMAWFGLAGFGVLVGMLLALTRIIF